MLHWHVVKYFQEDRILFPVRNKANHGKSYNIGIFRQAVKHTYSMCRLFARQIKYVNARIKSRDLLAMFECVSDVMFSSVQNVSFNATKLDK